MMTLKKAQRTENPGNSARILVSVKLPEFDGSTHTIVRGTETTTWATGNLLI